MSHDLQQRTARRNCLRHFVWLVLAATVLLPSCGPSEVTHPRDIRRMSVSSTAMRSVGYDASTRVLTVEFPNGSVYEYEGVPSEIHDGLMNAKSHGNYFHSHIRNAGFRTKRIR